MTALVSREPGERRGEAEGRAEYLIDTHCHLEPDEFPDPDDVLTRARAAGVGRFVVVGVGRDLDAPRRAVALAERRDDVSAVVGVHPHDAGHVGETAHDEIAGLAARPSVVAVGEIGLDHHYDHSARDEQAAVFRRYVALARRLKKPIVVHTRSAPGETIEILTSEGAADVGGIIHCFSEDRPFARRALDLGFDLSFSGIVTFKNAAAIRDVAAWAPLGRILVETDSPYLAPTPLRGKRCEPAYIVHTARFVASLRGVSFEELAHATTENAKRRLGLS